MNFSTLTLGELLTMSDEIIKRNAMSILKQLQRAKEEEINEKFHHMVQNWGEQHPSFNTKEHIAWLRKKQ